MTIAEQPADDGYRQTRIHFGKNRGLMLSELTPQQVHWYESDWMPKKEVNGPTSVEDLALINAFKAYRQAGGSKAGDPAPTASVGSSRAAKQLTARKPAWNKPEGSTGRPSRWGPGHGNAAYGFKDRRRRFSVSTAEKLCHGGERVYESAKRDPCGTRDLLFRPPSKKCRVCTL